jgi:hypothetical protein
LMLLSLEMLIVAILAREVPTGFRWLYSQRS